jgi:uncharacterized protein YcfL
MKYLILLASVAILGCSSESTDEDDQSILLDSAKAPLEKAEAVEGIVLESKDRIDDAVDEADD